MTIRGKQRPPLASQSIAKAFWVILAHTYTQTQGYTHRQQEDTPQGHINHIHTRTHIHKKNEGRAAFIPSLCLRIAHIITLCPIHLSTSLFFSSCSLYLTYSTCSFPLSLPPSLSHPLSPSGGKWRLAVPRGS